MKIQLDRIKYDGAVVDIKHLTVKELFDRVGSMKYDWKTRTIITRRN